MGLHHTRVGIAFEHMARKGSAVPLSGPGGNFGAPLSKKGSAVPLSGLNDNSVPPSRLHRGKTLRSSCCRAPRSLCGGASRGPRQSDLAPEPEVAPKEGHAGGPALAKAHLLGALRKDSTNFPVTSLSMTTPRISMTWSRMLEATPRWLRPGSR